LKKWLRRDARSRSLPEKNKRKKMKKSEVIILGSFKEAILEHIKNSNDVFMAEEIADAIPIPQRTVYRYLNEFWKKGEIGRIKGRGKTVYGRKDVIEKIWE
jgi:Fe2+ or Zn2+ uptake regulation protein